jgi:hypothetical protein
MATTTFSGPVVSNAGFSSDDTLNSADLSTGSYNLTDFTVRPASTWTGTVAALVGAVNSRTAGVSGGTVFGCYAQTSLGSAATTVITGMNAAVYGVVDVGASTNVGGCYGAAFDFTSFVGSRASRPTAFIAFGDQAQNSLGVLNLFEVGTTGKNVSSGASGNVLFTTAAPGGAQTGSLRVLVNGNIRYIPLYSSQV